MLEQEVGPGIGVADVDLRIQRLDADGSPDISPARTDAQGGYRLSGAFEPGDYVISVHDDNGNVLARQRFEITNEMSGKIEGLTVWLPLDPRLRGEPPPEPVTAPVPKRQPQPAAEPPVEAAATGE
jgi:hypothetical protein